ncbi:MAG: hypothetical protein ACI9MC_002996 [Kiritimatiellia bacterium]|jgi:hypothetical protein
MRSLLLLGLGLSLIGCDKEVETDTDTDRDTGTVDIPPTFLGYIEKPSDVERQGEHIRVAAVQVRVQGDGSWLVVDTLASGKLSGTGNFGMELPEVISADQHVDLGAGMRGAVYVPVAFDDLNNDEVYQDGVDDLVLGFSSNRWLAWIEAGGDSKGWAVVDTTVEPWKQYPLTEQTVVRLRGLDAVGKISGIYEGEDKSLGVVSVDAHVLDGEYDDFAAWQAQIKDDSGQFTATVDVRPPIGLFFFPEGSIRYVSMLNLLYRDNDASGSWTDGDQLTNRSLCYEGKPLYLRFSDTPRTLAVARQLGALDWTSGWRFYVHNDGAEIEVGRDKLRWIPVDDACTVSLPSQ